MQEKTAGVGFEWDTTEEVLAKVNEELHELEEARLSGDQDHIEEEFGDVLFSLVNYARYLKVDPETALERINKKFKSRFQYIEDQATQPLQDMTLEQMDELWNVAKSIEKKNP